MSLLTYRELFEEDDRRVCSYDGRTLVHTGLPHLRNASDKRTVDLSSTPVERKDEEFVACRTGVHRVSAYTVSMVVFDSIPHTKLHPIPLTSHPPPPSDPDLPPLPSSQSAPSTDGVSGVRANAFLTGCEIFTHVHLMLDQL